MPIDSNTRRGQGFSDTTNSPQERAARGQVQYGTKAALSAGVMAGGYTNQNLSISSQVDQSNPYPFLAAGAGAMAVGLSRRDDALKKKATDADNTTYNELLLKEATLKQAGDEDALADFYDTTESNVMTTTAGQTKVKNWKMQGLGEDPAVLARRAEEQASHISHAQTLSTEDLKSQVADSNLDRDVRFAYASVIQGRSAAGVSAQQTQASQVAIVALTDHVLSDQVSVNNILDVLKTDGIAPLDFIQSVPDLNDEEQTALLNNWAQVRESMQGLISSKVATSFTSEVTPDTIAQFNASVVQAPLSVQPVLFNGALGSLITNPSLSASERLASVEMLNDSLNSQAESVQAAVRPSIMKAASGLLSARSEETVKLFGATTDPEDLRLIATNFMDDFNKNSALHDYNVTMGYDPDNPNLLQFTDLDGDPVNLSEDEDSSQWISATAVVESYKKEVLRNTGSSSISKSMEARMLSYQHNNEAKAFVGLSETQSRQILTEYNLTGTSGSLPIGIQDNMKSLMERTGTQDATAAVLSAAIITDSLEYAERSSDPEATRRAMTGDLVPAMVALAESNPEYLMAALAPGTNNPLGGKASVRHLLPILASAMQDTSLTTTERRNISIVMSIGEDEVKRFTDSSTGEFNMKRARAYFDETSPVDVNQIGTVITLTENINMSGGSSRDWGESVSDINRFALPSSMLEQMPTQEQARFDSDKRRFAAAIPIILRELNINLKAPTSQAVLQQVLGVYVDYVNSESQNDDFHAPQSEGSNTIPTVLMPSQVEALEYIAGSYSTRVASITGGITSPQQKSLPVAGRNTVNSAYQGSSATMNALLPALQFTGTGLLRCSGDRNFQWTQNDPDAKMDVNLAKGVELLTGIINDPYNQSHGVSFSGNVTGLTTIADIILSSGIDIMDESLKNKTHFEMEIQGGPRDSRLILHIQQKGKDVSIRLPYSGLMENATKLRALEDPINYEYTGFANQQAWQRDVDLKEKQSIAEYNERMAAKYPRTGGY